MSTPYFTAKPGDTLLSKQWNELQIRLRDEILNHTHSGGEQGAKIAGDGIDPKSALTIRTLSVTESFSLGDPVQIFVSSTGNVGIGTTTPGTYRLQVAGALRASTVSSDKVTTTALEGLAGLTVDGALKATSLTATTVSATTATTTTVTASTVTTSGNVGIGTTNPGARLSIQAGTTDHGTASANRFLFASGPMGNGKNNNGGVEFRLDNLQQGIGFGSTTIYATGSNTDQELNVHSRGASPVGLNNRAGGKVHSGQLGINTVPASGDLQFASTTGDKIVLWENSTTDRHGIGITTNNTSVFIPDAARFSVRSGASSTGTERFVVTGAGDATIGNNLNVTGAAAAASLSVTGAAAAASLNVTGAAAAGSLNVSGTTASGSLNVTGAAAAASLSVTGTATAATLNVTGNAGVAGALSVSGASTVGGNATFNGVIIPKHGNSGSVGIQFAADIGGGSSDTAYIRYFATSGETCRLVIACENDADDAIVLRQAGAERITIANGMVTLEPNTALWCGGKLLAASDERLKRDITPLENALEKVLAVRGVRFHWKDPSRNQGPEIGVVAQDVEAVFPEAVSADKDGVKAVDYAHLVAPLIEALREQQTQIEALRAEVQALRAVAS